MEFYVIKLKSDKIIYYIYAGSIDKTNPIISINSINKVMFNSEFPLPLPLFLLLKSFRWSVFLI